MEHPLYDAMLAYAENAEVRSDALAKMSRPAMLSALADCDVECSDAFFENVRKAVVYALREREMQAVVEFIRHELTGAQRKAFGARFQDCVFEGRMVQGHCCVQLWPDGKPQAATTAQAVGDSL